MTRNMILAGCAALAVAAGVLFLVNRPSQESNTVAQMQAGTSEPMPWDNVDTSSVVEMAMGAEDAPITMIEYASYTCPHCARFHSDTFKNIKKDYIDTGKVRFIYREVYFDQFGLKASLMARCAGPDRFFGITDLLFTGQKSWVSADSPEGILDGIKKVGRLAGMDSDELDTCMSDDGRAEILVAWYQQNATKDGIRATPSFVVNGESVDNQPYDDFKALFDSLLAE